MADETGSKATLHNGSELSCLVCGNDTFHRREWKLNTTGMSFFDLDFLNKSATCYVCAACRYIHWFNI